MSENKMNMNLIHKVSRHDNSITEEEKNEFRNSPEWKEFRVIKYNEQDGKDFVTRRTIGR